MKASMQYVLLAMVSNLIHAKYETDEQELLKIFKQLHPANETLSWPEADILDELTHRRICDNVVDQIQEEYIDKKSYVKVRSKDIQSKRLLKKAKVKFEKGILEMNLVKCVYRNRTFYLADGDDQRVFRLEKRPPKILALLRIKIRMKTFNFLFLVLTFLLVHAEWIIDEIQLQNMYKDLHPNRKFIWEEADELDSTTLNRICRNVNDQLYNETVDEKTYVPINSSEIQSDRVIRNARVRFGRGFEVMTLIECVFKEKTFYLAHGDLYNVFRLQRDSFGFYRFTSGMHFVFFILAW